MAPHVQRGVKPAFPQCQLGLHCLAADRRRGTIPPPQEIDLPAGWQLKAQSGGSVGYAHETWVKVDGYASILAALLETLIASGFRIKPMTTDIARLQAKVVITPALKSL